MVVKRRLDDLMRHLRGASHDDQIVDILRAR